MKLFSIKQRVFSTFLLLLFWSLLAGCSEEPDKQQDPKAQQTQNQKPPKLLILVVDTSSSMSYHKNNIFPQVKKSLKKFIHPLDKGDVVQLVTFDRKTKIFPPIPIKSEDSKEPILKILEGFEAKGEATYSSLMIKNLYQLSQKLQEDYPSHETTAVVLSDGYDKPPKGAKRINLNKYANENPDAPFKDYFVHYIALGVLDKKIAQDLKNVAPKTKVHKIDRDKEEDKEKAGEELDKVVKTIDKQESTPAQEEGPSLWLHPIAITIYILIIVIAALIYYWLKKKLILEGYLAYWKTEENNPETLIFNLSEKKKGKIAIGRGPKNELNIKDFSSREPMILYAAFSHSRVVPKLKWKLKNARNFKSHVASHREHISDGDIWSAGNYTFKYTR